ncbi:MAG: hypothetical protein M1819_001119 [Sarea resinae]|nr:MAG: hypothetical protein M1819_001119 [Sarea resinae]
MFRRSLLRQSRALSSRLQNAATSSSIRPQFQPTRSPLAEFGARRLAASRYYSTASEEKKGTEGEAPAAAAEGQESKQEEDPSKKELEAKNKEIIDLKVRLAPHARSYCFSPILVLRNRRAGSGRIPSSFDLKKAKTPQDKYLRSVAEFRNLQERTKRDVQAAKDFAIQKFAKDLVESIDNLDRALVNVPADKLKAQADLANLYDGLKMTEAILMQTLKKHGLERFDPAENSEKFDPNKHEATFMTPQQEKEDGSVFFTQQKGFLLNGRVLRAAKVGVVKNN